MFNFFQSIRSQHTYAPHLLVGDEVIEFFKRLAANDELIEMPLTK